ncbi:hypothetical protein DVH24_028612 [Malus domestica]|uniref:Uncharacterized protein n=1 Tax=Malus domestica TaxID=3750 RepID=A0A498IZG7_MALDO|nr:hypothetical protein DVH24_028612 [Malus domestica]
MAREQKLRRTPIFPLGCTLEWSWVEHTHFSGEPVSFEGISSHLRPCYEAEIAAQLSAQDNKMSMILRALQMSDLQISMPAPDLTLPLTS